MRYQKIKSKCFFTDNITAMFLDITELNKI